MKKFVVLLLCSILFSFEAKSNICDPPDVLILLDRSGSMKSLNRWDSAKSAIKQITKSYAGRINFGLSFFPGVGSGSCDINQSLDAKIGSTKKNIEKELNNTSPSGSTPLTLGLQNAVRQIGNSQGRKYILLISDGGETCPSGLSDKQRVSNLTNVAKAAVSQNINIFAVGFGSGVSKDQLNAVGKNGGVPKSGGGDSFYQADNQSELTTVMDTIAKLTSTEVCDGKDNDCDGLIDEDLKQECSSECGKGEEVCNNGVWENCTALNPEPEICDGKDNNCNGLTDEITADNGLNCGSISVCLCGSCKGPCQRGECPLGSVCIDGYCLDPCCANPCPKGYTCQQDGSCKSDKSACASCSADEFCYNDTCVEKSKDCRFPEGKCLAGQECMADGTCAGSDCANQSCAENEFCRLDENGSAQCISTCQGCLSGEICKDGKCEAVANDCAQTCIKGFKCIDKTCVSDPCKGYSCALGKSCYINEKGKTACRKDSCLSISCPAGFSCLDGECLKTQVKKPGSTTAGASSAGNTGSGNTSTGLGQTGSGSNTGNGGSSGQSSSGGAGAGSVDSGPAGGQTGAANGAGALEDTGAGAGTIEDSGCNLSPESQSLNKNYYAVMIAVFIMAMLQRKRKSFI